jgi:tetratricopeptide (TPR) repeat protein
VASAGLRGEDVLLAAEEDLALLFGAASDSPAQATLIMDAGGRLCRAILRETRVEEIEAVLESLTEEPISPADLIFQGEAHLTRGEPRTALPLLASAVRLDPDDARSQLAFAFALLSVGRRDEALAPLKRAVALDPEASAEAYNNLGSILRAQGDPAAAVGSDASGKPSGFARRNLPTWSA